jgi:hypothetical protein
LSWLVIHPEAALGDLKVPDVRTRPTIPTVRGATRAALAGPADRHEDHTGRTAPHATARQVI